MNKFFVFKKFRIDFNVFKRDILKAAFFVSEEIGMLGSKQADPKFFEDVGYALQFDAPTGNWFSVQCSGTKLWTESNKPIHSRSAPAYALNRFKHHYPTSDY